MKGKSTFAPSAKNTAWDQLEIIIVPMVFKVKEAGYEP